MRLAVVFDDLTQSGGAEKLLLAVHELYPDAPVYTSLASDDWLKRCADKRMDLKTSFMQKLPFKKSLNRFYGLLGLHVLAFSSFNLNDFDLVLSISARFAHGVITKPDTTHVCYMNSPGRMFWEPHDYFCKEGLFWYLAAPFLSLHRLHDYVSAQRVDYFIANSLTPKERIRKYYRRDSVVVYPFVDLVPVGDGCNDNRGYFLVITRLNAWKRVDVAINACKRAGVSLKIVGEGPDRGRLESLSRQDGGKADFLGYVSEQEKVSALLGCRALIMTQKEDFGITALEAMSLGKPVIAYRAGGALETVTDGVTGQFFDLQNAESLASVLSVFDSSRYKPEDCKNQAGKFSKQKFMQELDGFVKKVYDRRNACATGSTL